MIESNRIEVSTEEKKYLSEIIKGHIDLKTIHFGTSPRTVVRYDKRPLMYGGNGIVYLLQMFDKGELVNNRIGAYMILPTSEDSVGFHSHYSRKEQELYLVISGKGEYLEKKGNLGSVKSYTLQKGNITTINGKGFHSIKNIAKEPLIIFVITTYEK